MGNSVHPSTGQFGGEACYRIVVQGSIPDSWKERLAGMALSTAEQRGGQVSVLQGVIRDQAELSGVLESLYRLQSTIVSVERL